MAFGERLQEVRRRSGMTQEEFAAQLRVSRQAVSKWESGRGYPEIEKIIYICNRWGVTMDVLFDEEVPGGAAADAPAEGMPAGERSLGTLLSGFFSNLSPREKWTAAGSFAAVTVLLLLCVRLLKGGPDHMMALIWVGAILVFGIAEAVTAALVSIWFVAGAAAAMIAAVCGFHLFVQLVVFLAVSAIALALTRPLVKRLGAAGTVPTNADRVLGQRALVTEAVDNRRAAGAVYADGKTWSARSADGELLPAGTQVRVEKIEGVKLLVKKEEEMEE